MSLRRTRPLEEALRLVRTRALSGWGGAGRLRRGEPAALLPQREQQRLAKLLDACLEPRLGEVIARARAAELAALYLGLEAEGRARFFQVLATRAAIDPARVAEAAEMFRDVARRNLRAATNADKGRKATGDAPASALSSTPAAQPPDAEAVRAAAALREAVTPPWEQLFRLFCGLDHGVKFAVDLRADLLATLSAARRGEMAGEVDRDLLARVDDDLRAVLKGLFDVGLLQLHRITWQSPAAFLEKLIRYEAVHAIASWADLKNRLRADRRCYAFVHPGMPDEPLIFVEVALSNGLADRIGPLLDLDSPVTEEHEADTAIFYSISACQEGLNGVSLGDFLIKQVVTDLARELPGLENFATLSPIPGFRAWLQDMLQRAPAELLQALDNDSRAALAEVARSAPVESGTSTADNSGADSESAPPHVNGRGRSSTGATDWATPERGLARLLGETSWMHEPALAGAVKPALVRLAARYLTTTGDDRRVVDRVGNFHLTNGARVERVNWLANLSPSGLRESLGLMVNYRYDLDRIERNHTDYVLRGRVSTSPAVGRVLG